jgi:hypothetical protein
MDFLIDVEKVSIESKHLSIVTQAQEVLMVGLISYFDVCIVRLKNSLLTFVEHLLWQLKLHNYFLSFFFIKINLRKILFDTQRIIISVEITFLIWKLHDVYSFSFSSLA